MKSDDEVSADDVSVTAFLGEHTPGELRCSFGRWGLGGRGWPPGAEVLTCPSGSLPRAVVRHVGMEVALWEGGRGDPTVSAVAREAGLDEASVELALEILAGVTRSER